MGFLDVEWVEFYTVNLLEYERTIHLIQELDFATFSLFFPKSREAPLIIVWSNNERICHLRSFFLASIFPKFEAVTRFCHSLVPQVCTLVSFLQLKSSWILTQCATMCHHSDFCICPQTSLRCWSKYTWFHTTLADTRKGFHTLNLKLNFFLSLQGHLLWILYHC